MINDVFLTCEKQIEIPKGNVYHAMKNNSPGFNGFGEAYFSFVDKDAFKGWKKHLKMTLNLIVPIGRVKFVLFDPRENSSTCGEINEFVIGGDNYKRLTVPPGVWCGFMGIDDGINMLLNLADMLHDPNEAERMDEAENNLFNYQW